MESNLSTGNAPQDGGGPVPLCPAVYSFAVANIVHGQRQRKRIQVHRLWLLAMSKQSNHIRLVRLNTWLCKRPAAILNKPTQSHDAGYELLLPWCAYAIGRSHRLGSAATRGAGTRNTVPQVSGSFPPEPSGVCCPRIFFRSGVSGRMAPGGGIRCHRICFP